MSLRIRKNISLKKHTTFHIGGPARFFIEAKNENDCIEALQFVKTKNLDLLILGGGSNVVFQDKGFDGVVLRVQTKGIKILKNTFDTLVIESASGEEWDDFVKQCVLLEGWGVENLSAIPGTVGASVVQNIGGYGCEVKDTVEEVHTIDVFTGRKKVFLKKDCDFSYRKSIFNTVHKGKHLITKVVFALKKKGGPNVSYKDLHSYFKGKGVISPSLSEVRNAVVEIRHQKLPDPKITGSAGSFFKNTILSEKSFKKLLQTIRKNFPNIADETEKKLNEFKSRFSSHSEIKIPSAFLLEICGLKGYKVGGAKIDEKNPLVIVNETNSATYKDVSGLFSHAREVVQKKTGVLLENEPQFIP